MDGKACMMNLSGGPKSTTRLSVFDLRVPVVADKLEDPTTNLTFLGIELDISLMTRRFPLTKLMELKATLSSWLGKKYCLMKD